MMSMVANQDKTAPAGIGCTIAAVGAVIGFGIWLYSPPAGYRWEFEGEGPGKPYYMDLPLMVFGLPVLALLTWRLVIAVERTRGRKWVPLLATCVALVVFGFAGSLYMASQESDSPYAEEGI
ncbi:hypothetical protein E1265_33240 [Streptomyces sp. 8K308]|uniref:hypothetical protein n=1 Tax=Streptomyces sp. 8K308 TaxID=2530388 RepID=UPI001042F7EE|nr:hypothetical protein [Streptomyces sp. 8K308]TDC08360.1 hypothetical protein E1265_33240 [Streptomyces sp. 8K308]